MFRYYRTFLMCGQKWAVTVPSADLCHQMPSRAVKSPGLSKPAVGEPAEWVIVNGKLLCNFSVQDEKFPIGNFSAVFRPAFVPVTDNGAIDFGALDKFAKEGEVKPVSCGFSRAINGRVNVYGATIKPILAMRVGNMMVSVSNGAFAEVSTALDWNELSSEGFLPVNDCAYGFSFESNWDSVRMCIPNSILRLSAILHKAGDEKVGILVDTGEMFESVPRRSPKSQNANALLFVDFLPEFFIDGVSREDLLPREGESFGICTLFVNGEPVAAPMLPRLIAPDDVVEFRSPVDNHRHVLRAVARGGRLFAEKPLLRFVSGDASRLFTIPGYARFSL